MKREEITPALAAKLMETAIAQREKAYVPYSHFRVGAALLAEDGTVYRNGEALEEQYVNELALGEKDVETPLTVPESRYFVCGDHRSVSIDSRSTSVGCIAEENIIGKVVAVVGPIKSFRFL